MLGDKGRTLLFSRTLEVARDIAAQLEEPAAGLYFDWGPDSSRYIPHAHPPIRAFPAERRQSGVASLRPWPPPGHASQLFGTLAKMHSARFHRPVVITRHAAHRMAERRVTPELLLRVIDEGQTRYSTRRALVGVAGRARPR